MSVIILLLGASLFVSGIFLAAFIWTLRHDQYEDEYSPPRRILFEDGVHKISGKESADDDHNLSIIPAQKH